MTDDKTPVEPATDAVEEDDEVELDEGELHDPSGNFLDEGQDKDTTGDQPNGGM